ncbi:MAG TPA: DUF885 domain-containing protein, partial [Gammaproteobacteria bacterium]|nr:DUF885 domain-containing protein [Gammaproteobacteria bacterium]
MKGITKQALAVAVGALWVSAATTAAAAEADWVKESNQDAMVLLKVTAEFTPEFAGRSGVDGLDDKIFDLKPGVFERRQQATGAALKELEARRQTAADPNVKQDLEILIASGQKNMASATLDKKYMLDFIDAAQIEFSGIRFLLDKQVPKERQKAALARLRLYAGDAPGVTPLTVLAEQRTEERFAVPGLTGPYVQEVQDGMDNGKQYMDGIQQLFQQSGLSGWEDDFSKLKQQDQDYN